MTVIPNGCKLGGDAPSAQKRAAAKRALGLNPAANLIVAVGRLTAQKRHHVLIDSMQHVSGGHLWIAGEGEDRGALEARIAAAGSQERVRLIGNVSPGDVRQLLTAADVFAMASEFEGLSLALVEAMAAGVPIVASDIPPIREVLVDDIGVPSGILVKSTEPAEWADAIVRVTGSDELNQQYSRRAQRRAQSFDIDRSASEYVAIAEARLDLN
jgi:glycosyltransferase involved in cell wall biosynthesis